jgi:2-polyprenyl-6-methoxyphenol hydroxylase-like FAD-dependent oxidoreductase
VFAFSDSKDLVIQVLGDGGLHVSAWTVRSENWMRDSGYDVHDLEQAKEAEKKEFADWVPELTSALDSVDPGVASRNLYMLPTDFTWKHKRGVTLLGDAAHLMTPFAGIGANLAMQDALELSYAIIAAAKDTEKPSKTGALDEHIKKYEKKLFPRMHTAQEVSASSMQYIFFTEGFPRSAIQKWCATVATHDMPLLMRPLVTVALYVYFFFFRMLV